MKIIKFDHNLSELIERGVKQSTWRLFDDKDLSVNDEIRLVDKVDPDDPKSWRVIGQGKIKEVVEKQFGDISESEMLEHGYKSKDEMLRIYKGYYGDRVSWQTPIKVIYFEFKPKEEKVAIPAVLLEEARLYTDGGSRGNPGDSACAYAICNMANDVVEKSGFYLGMATNNQAEYMGFKRGLERARDLGIGKIHLFSDSQLVVNQMNGVYKVKNRELAPLHEEVKALADSFERISFNYVPRELNKVADGEVNRVLDEHERTT